MRPGFINSFMPARDRPRCPRRSPQGAATRNNANGVYPAIVIVPA